jgi:hypothetical protein
MNYHILLLNIYGLHINFLQLRYSISKKPYFCFIIKI